MLFSGKNVLVTGGAGFIGSNLAIRLATEGANVTVLDSMLPGYGGNLFNLEPVKKQIHINFSDMRDWHSLSYVVRGKDYIFNVAGQVSHQDSMVDPLMDMEINVKAQLVLLEACRNYNPGSVIVYTSTRQFYGSPQYLPVDENHPLNPPDVNGIGLHPSHWTNYVRVTDRITLTPYWEKGACHETKEIQQRVQTPSSRRTVKRHQFLSPALPQT